MEAYDDAMRGGPSRGGIRPLRLALPIIVALAALAPLSVAAADIRQGSQVTVGPGETVEDDLYAFGGTIDVEGTVSGSVIAFGGTITIGGNIARDLLVSGGTVNVTGHVGGSVRVGGGTLTLSGPVAEDVVVAGGTVTLGPNASVGRDLVLAGGTATVGAPVGRKILAGVGDLTLRNTVGGDVTVQVNHLRLESGAAVGGNLDYTSENDAVITGGAHVAGNTVRHAPTDRGGVSGPASGLLNWLRFLVGVFVLGLLLVLLFPGFSGRVINRLERSPWASLGIGAALLVGVPIVALIVFILGIFVGGWWLGLFMIAAYLLACGLGYVVSSLLLGRWGSGRMGWGVLHPAWQLLAGLVVLSIASLIPIVGGLIALAAVLFGLGALALGATERRPATPA